MCYILFYKTVENYIEKRQPFRAEHLKHINLAHERGDIVMAGALSEPADMAVIIFKCDNANIVEEFAKADPYVVNGLITKWEVRPWTEVISG